MTHDFLFFSFLLSFSSLRCIGFQLFLKFICYSFCDKIEGHVDLFVFRGYIDLLD